ncbi:MAG TPA: methionine adenosyltransferase [Anaerolineales bacterium]|nr:methionine adenosyltransferase [Anaerolineales bacterium]
MTTSFMNSPSLLFTSESVTEGHPDKMCDQISDAVLDACLAQDPKSRVACEAATKTGFVILLGEITTLGQLDFDTLARKVITGIGYDDSSKGFDGNTCAVQVAVAKQSGDIAMGVNHSYESRSHAVSDDEVENLGAGDQGMMFGFACDETEMLMPLPIHLAHRLTRRMAQVRKSGELPWMRPDGKSQVTIEYRHGRPARVDTVLISTQHSPEAKLKQIQEAVRELVILPTLPADLVDSDLKIYVNPTGMFVTGGPMGDSGLTGRKIIVDTYGGAARHGGGCFSGKDPTKVDRSGAYAARWVAKHIVAAGLAERCEIQVAYAIGVAHPLSINVETFGTGTIPDQQIATTIGEVFDLRPGAIIRDLELRRPIFQPTATYGHFGRDDLDLPWERLDRLEQVRATVGVSAVQQA